ncbi:SRPBCC domain-containing protein [bacterium]|nr:SRPBCC domain-containing protein [bacterium]
MFIDLPLETTVRRTFAASPDRVFRAWTTASELTQWFCPDPKVPCECRELDPRVGGHYSLTVVGSKGPRTVSGEYLEVTPPSRLVFTWLWDGHPDTKLTTVTLTFERTAEGGCALTLHHARFPDQNMADEHRKGWTALLSTLAGSLGEVA